MSQGRLCQQGRPFYVSFGCAVLPRKIINGGLIATCGA